jgi:hypothetical protein
MEYVGSRNLHRLLIETPDKFLGTYPINSVEQNKGFFDHFSSLSRTGAHGTSRPNRSYNIVPRFTWTFLTFLIRSISIFIRPNLDPRAEQRKKGFQFNQNVRK